MGGSVSLFSPTSIAAFVLFIGILIFVHELGHFLAAKYFGIKVLKFSLGFGPPLFRFTRGETVYQIAMLPLGGFVKMLGDAATDEIAPEDRARAFNTVPVYQRALVAVAGPAFNLIFPVMCFFAYYVLGPTVIAPVIGQVELGTPAEKAGLRSGDRILTIDGTRVWDFDGMSALVRDGAGQLLHLQVERSPGAAPIEVDVIPKTVQDEDLFGTAKSRGMIGVSAAQLGTRLGVEVGAGDRAGLRTGDRVVSIAGEKVSHLADLERVAAAHAGSTVRLVVARPTSLGAGDLFFAIREEPRVLELPIPTPYAGLSELGLFPSETFVRSVVPGGASARAGLRPNDRVLEVDGTPVSLFFSFEAALQKAESRPVKVKVKSAGEAPRTLTIVSDKREVYHEVTGKMRPYYDPGLGAGDLPRRVETGHWYSGGGYVTEKAQVGLAEALRASVEQTLKVIGETVTALFKLFVGEISPKTVGGPIMLFQVAAQAAELGIFVYLHLLAMISVNIGIINLLPMPIFDGGHLLFCAVEAIKRKPVSLRVREAATIVGLVLLVLLAALVFSNDLGLTK
jgi:regulator of sigma E protease